MMENLRWYSLVAAAILVFGPTPLKAQDPLEQLEAKLLLQEKIETPKAIETKKPKSGPSSENLPLPNKIGKSLLVNPTNPLTIPTPFNDGTGTGSGTSAASSTKKVDVDPPFLGMTLERPIGGGMGLRVVEVVNQSPAWKSGFRVEDRVLAIAGNSVTDIDAFADEISKSAPNQVVKFLIDRRGRQMAIDVVLIPRSLAAKTLPNAVIPANPVPATPSSLPLPSSRLAPRIPQAMDGRGSLGVLLAPLSDAFRQQFGIPVFRGASVIEVSEKSPGFMAGLVAGDCIVDIDGRSISNDQDVVRWKQSATLDSIVSISFYRGSQLMQTTLQLPPTDGQINPAMQSESTGSDITPDMLTPEYLQRLRAELAQIRSELTRSQSRVQSLEKQISERR